MRAGVIGVLLGRSVCHRCDTGERTLAIGPCTYARMAVTHVCVSGAPPADGRAVQMWIVLCVMVVLPGRLWAIKKGGLADRPRLRNRGVRFVLSARTSRRGWCDRFHAGSDCSRTDAPAGIVRFALVAAARKSVSEVAVIGGNSCWWVEGNPAAGELQGEFTQFVDFFTTTASTSRLGRAALAGACALAVRRRDLTDVRRRRPPSPEKNITIFTTLVEVVRSAQPPPQRPSKEPRIT